jgi:hypothetical protein
MPLSKLHKKAKNRLLSLLLILIIIAVQQNWL